MRGWDSGASPVRFQRSHVLLAPEPKLLLFCPSCFRGGHVSTSALCKPSQPGSSPPTSFTVWNLGSQHRLSRGLTDHLPPGSCWSNTCTPCSSCTVFPTWQFITRVFFMMRDSVFITGFRLLRGRVHLQLRHLQVPLTLHPQPSLALLPPFLPSTPILVQTRQKKPQV